MLSPDAPRGILHPERIAASAQGLALFGMLALTVLQPLWYGWLMPPRTASPIIAAILASIPWWLAWMATARSRARGVLWGGAVALFYFSHGVAVAWSGDGIERALALAEVFLTLLVIVPPGTVAWRSRRLARATAR